MAISELMEDYLIDQEEGMKKPLTCFSKPGHVVGSDITIKR